MPALEGADSLASEKAAPVEEAPVEKAPVKSDALEDSETGQSTSEMVQSARPLCPLENVRCESQPLKGTRCDRGTDCPNPAVSRSACTISRYGYEAVEASCSQERDVRIVYVPGYGYVKAITCPY